jgi:hypothetical protein
VFVVIKFYLYLRSVFGGCSWGLEKKGEYNGMAHNVFVDFKKAYDSVKREVLYNILFEFSIPKKLVSLIKMCLNETYSKVHVGKLFV